jgi:hypothetical protein
VRDGGGQRIEGRGRRRTGGWGQRTKCEWAGRPKRRKPPETEEEEGGAEASETMCWIGIWVWTKP